MKMSKGKDLCAFCRMPLPSSDEERLNRTKKLMDNGNALAFNILARYYVKGIRGFSQDYQSANELYLKAGELGCADGYYKLGISYHRGKGVQVDMKIATHYYELAAMSGHVNARHNLACIEGAAGNNHRSIKHFIMAAKAGFEKSLEGVKIGYKHELVTKDEYASTLRAYHERQKEMNSDERDRAAASGMYTSG